MLARKRGDHVRILLLSAVLLSTASCVLPPPLQPGANCPSARQALAAGAPGAPPTGLPPVALVPTPLPATTALQPAPAAPPPAAAPVASLPWPPLFLFGPSPRPGRLTLSNVTFDLADMQAVVTPYPDCALHPGIGARVFQLPLNGTWIIPTPPGSDVCWRRVVPGAAPTAAGWNRAFTAAGHFIDARL
jgi:hypothetical protein